MLVVLCTVYDYLLLLFVRLFGSADVPCLVVLIRYLEDSHDVAEWLLWSSVALCVVCLRHVLHWSTACLVSVGTHLLVMLYWFGPGCNDVPVLRAVAATLGLGLFASVE